MPKCSKSKHRYDAAHQSVFHTAHGIAQVWAILTVAALSLSFTIAFASSGFAARPTPNETPRIEDPNGSIPTQLRRINARIDRLQNQIDQLTNSGTR